MSHDGNAVGIGPAFQHQSPDIGDLGKATRYGPVEVRSGNWRDPQGRDGSASADEVVSFLKAIQAQQHRRHGPTAEIVFADFGPQKTLRVNSAATREERRLLAVALSKINTALPWENRILLGRDISEQVARDEIPAGEIHVHITDGKSSWPQRDEDYEPSVLGIGGSNHDDGVVVSGYAYLDRLQIGSDNRYREFVITHEILHAYGFGAHVDPDQYPDSILRPEVGDLRDLDSLPKVFLTLDGEVLLAETKIEHGTRLPDLTSSDLGPWSDTGFHLLGWTGLDGQDSQVIRFGAGFRNGLGKPWAYGPAPAGRFQDNPELTETATWTGSLLGFSRAGSPVAGAAEISIDFRDLDGRADFTELESWASGTHPGAPGSGRRWGDGDLGYTIELQQNGNRASLVSAFAPGDDPGVVTGALVGGAHEGATGVVEHPDLSAAFGAVR